MRVERAFAQLIAPDVLTPMQWHAGVYSESPPFYGTKRLMLAVLVDALRCLQIGARGRTAIQRRSLAEAEFWIADRRSQGPFSFETVCEAVGINPDWLRESLCEWRRQRLSGGNTHRQIRRSPTTRTGPIGSSVRRRRRRANKAALAGGGVPDLLYQLKS